MVNCKKCRIKMKSDKRIHHGGIKYGCASCGGMIFLKLKGPKSRKKIILPLYPGDYISPEGIVVRKGHL